MTMVEASPVEFGISLPNRAVLLDGRFGISTDTLIETAVRAEASGWFDSVWVGDNLLSRPRLEAIVTLAALAGRTRRVKLGTVCLASFPMRDPVLLAIQWASLDVVSGGRTILAVCLGSRASEGAEFAAEHAALGVVSRERLPRLEEGIEVLRRFWEGGPVTYQGRAYHFADIEVWPKPVQPRVPIIIAGNPRPGTDPAIVERALRRVGRLADGWQSAGTSPELFRERWDRVREYASEYGRADAVTHSSLHLMVNINDDADAASQEALDFLITYYGAGRISNEFLEHWVICGPPEVVVAKLAAFVEAGCTTPILRFTAADQLGQLDRCITEVMPALHQLAGTGAVGSTA